MKNKRPRDRHCVSGWRSGKQSSWSLALTLPQTEMADPPALPKLSLKPLLSVENPETSVSSYLQCGWKMTPQTETLLLSCIFSRMLGLKACGPRYCDHLWVSCFSLGLYQSCIDLGGIELTEIHLPLNPKF